MEAEGSECEHWRFMRATGGRSAQHRDRDSWAACGRQREQGKGGGWRPREQRTRRGVQEDSPLPTAVARVRSEVPGCYERSRGLRGEGTH